ncbi:DUF6382 domain-containing protein [Paenibacillus sp. NPDC058071]|uniref:DUF6382 domain-containing protein n=1 Tax=Paenibacillus sp. NPDC058071 TaxID=3346326 RepID=UPI0036DD0520
MNDYRIDFSMQRGHEMIVDREKAIARAELDEIELQMLQNNRIPGLLPVEWMEFDGAITFRYALSGRRMLSRCLQMQRLSMEQFYALLLAIVETLIECKNYMLHPSGCLLEESCLFAGERLDDIGIAYMPLKREGSGLAGASGASGGGGLLPLIVYVSAYVHTIDGSGLQRLLRTFNDRPWPLNELRQVLLELIEAGSPSRSVYKSLSAEQSLPIARESHRQQAVVGQVPAPASVTAPASLERDPQAVWEHHIRLAYDGMEPDEEMSEEEAEPIDRSELSRKRWILTAVVLVGIACAWRYIYLPSAAVNGLYISLGLTLMGAAGLIYVWTKREAPRLLTGDRADDYDPDEFIPVSGPLRGGSSPFTPAASRASERSWPNGGAVASSIKQENAYGREDEHGSSLASVSDFARNIGKSNERMADSSAKTNDGPGPSMGTTVAAATATATATANATEATVLLGQSVRSGGPSLKREWSDGSAWLPWKGEKLTIGRAGESVDYEETAAGVSRLHLELNRESGSCRAKDLGSRNGSLLNGQAMVPYKSYSLSDGDVIHLAGVSGPAYKLSL